MEAPVAEQNAVGIREVSESELADFEKMVDLVLREHSEVADQRNRVIMQTTLVALALIGISAFSMVFSAESKFLVVVYTVLFGVALGSWYMSVWMTVRKRRRTCEELAEIVREAAPLFTPKMSAIRRAEIKIRLSTIGIYDALKYR